MIKLKQNLVVSISLRLQSLRISVLLLKQSSIAVNTQIKIPARNVQLIITFQGITVAQMGLTLTAKIAQQTQQQTVSITILTTTVAQNAKLPTTLIPTMIRCVVWIISTGLVQLLILVVISLLFFLITICFVEYLIMIIGIVLSVQMVSTYQMMSVVMMASIGMVLSVILYPLQIVLNSLVMSVLSVLLVTIQLILILTAVLIIITGILAPQLVFMLNLQLQSV